ncbi:MAG: hypothetical protein K9N49_09000 [Candidatus Marinimicrobia bacterium]|nr:hypothetical protein [Candidatus Neomarinimicrobiota bacterium]
MNTRERFQAVMQFKPFDRLPLLEWANWWNKTIERWHGEGLPGNVTDRYELCRFFGLDIYKQGQFQMWLPACPRPVSHGSGILKNEAEYERLRPLLYPREPVDPRQWAAWAQEQQRGEVVLWFRVDGFFWFARTLLGIEDHLYAFYDQPRLMHRINTDLAEWMVRGIEQLCAIYPPDFMTFAEDMSYNRGPMLSKDMFDEFLRPYYDRVIPTLRRHGVMPIVDSDGDVSVPAHWFAEAGLEGILPLERQAGVDIAALRAEFPTMKFIGHFDKMTMAQGPDAMRGEFERLLPTAARGGFLVSCDHQTPPGVSYENYKAYLALFREYAAKAGELSQQNAAARAPDAP